MQYLLILFELISCYIKGTCIEQVPFKFEYLFEILLNDVINLDEISVDTKESGLSTRVFAVLLSSLFNQVKISLDGTAKKRKFDFSSLEELGVLSSYEDGVIYLSGKLNSGKIIIRNSDTSQLLTGLLITLPFLKNDSIVVCTNLVSKTYIDITLDLLEQVGIIINNDSYKTFSGYS